MQFLNIFKQEEQKKNARTISVTDRAVADGESYY